MTMSLPVRVVLASGETFNRGRFRLAVMGVLVVQGDDIWIVDDPKAVDEICSTPPAVRETDQPPTEQVDARIRIVDPTFLARLAADIPPLASGDFAYFDPPYVPLSKTSNFRSYTSRGFEMSDQEQLRDEALRLKKKGVSVLLSNSSAPEVKELYKQGFKLIPVQASRAVNSKTSGRGKVTELLIK